MVRVRMDNYTEEIRWLPTETLRGAWEDLTYQLSGLCPLMSAKADLVPDGLATIRLAAVADHLRQIDQCVMNCLAADPLHRAEVGEDEVEIVLRFRSWWRESVPFLMDPDGRKDRYVYEAIPAMGAPAPPPDPRR